MISISHCDKLLLIGFNMTVSKIVSHYIVFRADSTVGDMYPANNVCCSFSPLKALPTRPHYYI